MMKCVPILSLLRQQAIWKKICYHEDDALVGGVEVVGQFDAGEGQNDVLVSFEGHSIDGLLGNGRNIDGELGRDGNWVGSGSSQSSNQESSEDSDADHCCWFNGYDVEEPVLDDAGQESPC